MGETVEKIYCCDRDNNDNAVNLGDCNVIQALQNCCCQTQRQIADFRADVQLQTCQQTGELRNGQRDLGFCF